jgi:hypothetical protein
VHRASGIPLRGRARIKRIGVPRDWPSKSQMTSSVPSAGSSHGSIRGCIAPPGNGPTRRTQQDSSQSPCNWFSTELRLTSAYQACTAEMIECYDRLTDFGLTGSLQAVRQTTFRGRLEQLHQGHDDCARGTYAAVVEVSDMRVRTPGACVDCSLMRVKTFKHRNANHRPLKCQTGARISHPAAPSSPPHMQRPSEAGPVVTAVERVAGATS